MKSRKFDWEGAVFEFDLTGHISSKGLKRRKDRLVLY